MYYAIYSIDNADSMEKRRSVRPAHLARLQELQHQGRLLIAGPMLHQDDENAAAKGSLVVAEFADIENAKAWAAADPYVTADVYARVTVEPFKKVFPSNE